MATKSKKTTKTTKTARKYDRDKLVPIICQRIASGETLTQICRSAGMPSHSQYCAWMLEDEKAADEYARARVARADVRADRIDEYTQRMLAGKIDPNQCRVAIDAEKWQAGKEQPKRYGDKLDLNHGGNINLTFTKDDADCL